MLDFSDVTKYDPTTDPSILNEFATVAYRFGHSTVRDFINGWPLSFHFLQSQDFFVVGNNGARWKKEMTAAIEELSPKNDLIIGDALRNHLFSPPNPQPEDLAARNIQRAREHGIPSYGKLREACELSGLDGGNKPLDINQVTWDKLLKTYQQKPKDIDPFTGGLAEEAPDDGIVGPLFACIIGKQFQRLKDGDRYFYTHAPGDNSRGLGDKTKQTVSLRTLGHIICENTNAIKTQENVFKEKSDTNLDENCDKITGLDFDGIVEDILKSKGQTTSGLTIILDSISSKLEENKISCLIEKAEIIFMFCPGVGTDFIGVVKRLLRPNAGRKSRKNAPKYF